MDKDKGIDFDDYQKKLSIIEKLENIEVWDCRDAAIYMRRSEAYVRRLMNAGVLKRDKQGNTRKEWVREFLDHVQTARGRVPSPLRKL